MNVLKYKEAATQMTESQTAKVVLPTPLTDPEEMKAALAATILSIGGLITEKLPDKIKERNFPYAVALLFFFFFFFCNCHCSFGAIKNVILLAARPARTEKYIAALLRGVPILNHTWVKKCVEAESVIDPRLPCILQFLLMPDSLLAKAFHVASWNFTGNKRRDIPYELCA